VICCAMCGAVLHKKTREINRAKKNGLNLYCNRTCSGLARRLKNPKSEQERKEEKRLYDARYRKDKSGEIKAKKQEYFKRTYDPVKAAEERKKRMPKHVEYCRRPDYRMWKREYDKRYRANKFFGDYAEAALLLQDIEREISQQASRYEIYRVNGTLNKAQTRKRSL
jgi:hypothetical protein